MLSREVTIEQDAELNQVNFSIYNKVDVHSVIENSSFGRYSCCEPYAMIQNTIIHSLADTARSIRIGTTQRPLQHPTIHHITYRYRMYGVRDTDDETFFEQRRSKLIGIGYNVRIRHSASVKAGVKAGNRTVIGSGAIMTHDVPSYATIVGVPTKILHFRFDCKQIAALLDTA